MFCAEIRYRPSVRWVISYHKAQDTTCRDICDCVSVLLLSWPGQTATSCDTDLSEFFFENQCLRCRRPVDRYKTILCLQQLPSTMGNHSFQSCYLPITLSSCHPADTTHPNQRKTDGTKCINEENGSINAIPLSIRTHTCLVHNSHTSLTLIIKDCGRSTADKPLHNRIFLMKLKKFWLWRWIVEIIILFYNDSQACAPTGVARETVVNKTVSRATLVRAQAWPS